jgi:uncharacterized protein YaiE (UPF0345 family)
LRVQNQSSAEIFRIDGSGNVGIGRTASNYSGYKTLAINGPSIGADIDLYGGGTYQGYLYTSTDSAGIGTVISTPFIFSTNNSERMRIDSSGSVMVGTTSVTSGSRFQVKGSTTTDAVVCFLFQNSASTTLFAALNSGQLYTGSASGSPYNNTTGSGANVFVASDGLLQRSTSSLKYKTDVIDATHGLKDLLKLRSVTYKGKNDGGTIFGGLIAEEVHEAGLTEFVQYAEDGTPDALAYGHMVSLCVKAIQELKAEVDSLKAQLNNGA